MPFMVIREGLRVDPDFVWEEGKAGVHLANFLTVSDLREKCILFRR
jgi:hypothetical protein